MHDVRAFLKEYWLAGDDPRQLRWDDDLADEDASETRVALLDTGFHREDSAFRGANIEARDFTGLGWRSDPHWHGTRDAALLVGEGGLAPCCGLLVARVVARHRDSAVAMEQALRWATAEEADIICIPVGRTHRSTAVERALIDARSAGCQIFAAAGNLGAMSFLFPAHARGVQAVTGADRRGQRLSFCCDAPQAVLAPGRGVPALPREGSTTISGSSPATVLAAGMAALRLSRTRKKTAVPLHEGS